MSKGYCLILNEQFVLAIPWGGGQVTFYEMNVCFVLNQYVLVVLVHWNKPESEVRYDATLLTHYPDF